MPWGWRILAWLQQAEVEWQKNFVWFLQAFQFCYNVHTLGMECTARRCFFQNDGSLTNNNEKKKMAGTQIFAKIWETTMLSLKVSHSAYASKPTQFSCVKAPISSAPVPVSSRPSFHAPVSIIIVTTKPFHVNLPDFALSTIMVPV